MDAPAEWLANWTTLWYPHMFLLKFLLKVTFFRAVPFLFGIIAELEVFWHDLEHSKLVSSVAYPDGYSTPK